MDLINPEVLKTLKEFGLAAIITVAFVWVGSKLIMTFMTHTFEHGEKQQDIQHKMLKEVTAMRLTIDKLVAVISGKLEKLDKHSERLRKIETKVVDIHSTIQHYHGNDDDNNKGTKVIRKNGTYKYFDEEDTYNG